MKKEKLLYFFYNRLNDPLLQSNIFLYINELAKENIYDVAIITYEDSKFFLTENEIDTINKKFAQQNIQWYRLKWHPGSHIFYKIIDLITGFLKVFNLTVFKGYKNIISLGSIAGSFIYLYSRILKINFYLYQYEPHSEYAVDNNIWGADSAQFKLLNKYEKSSVKNCKVVSSGTIYMQNRLKNWGVKAHFIKIRSVANSELFNFSEIKRNEFRSLHKIDASKKLIIYPGKLGDLYFDASILISAFKNLFHHLSGLHFLIVSPNLDEIKKELKKYNDDDFKNSFLLLPPISYSQMPTVLSASDLGIVAVAPGPSKKFISNIKVGEYLCSGLPYLICKGISEDDIVAKENNVGVVVNNFSEEALKDSYSEINSLLSQPKNLMVEKCRKIGVEYRGFKNQFTEYKKALALLIK
jgi:hypothetical protein